MNNIESSLYTVAIALCVFSAGLLRDRRSPTSPLPVWFMTFLMIETLGFALELLMVHPNVPLKAAWLGLRMATSLLMAPCLWLVVRENVEPVRPRLAALGRGHWVAIVAGAGSLVPLVATAHLGLGYADPHRTISLLHSRVIHGTMLLCIAIFAVQVPYYLWQCRLLLQCTGALKWLQLPLVVVVTTWALGLMRTIHCAAHAPKELSLLFALTDVGVSVGSMYLILRQVSRPEGDAPAGMKNSGQPPETISALSVALPAATVSTRLDLAAMPAHPAVTIAPVPEQRQPVARSDAPFLSAEGEATLPRPKYVRSNLDAATRERIRQKLESAVASESIWGDCLLNLRSLSRIISEKAHYVSQVINQDLDTSFYELVNRQRIEQAKKMLVAAPDQTVLEIAMAVGFNSKSTFNTAFRQNTGMTPREYRALSSGKQ